MGMSVRKSFRISEEDEQILREQIHTTWAGSNIQYLDVVDYDCTYRVMAYFRSGCKNEKARAFYEFLKKHAEV